MAYAAWQASTAYSVGNIVKATTLVPRRNGLVYRCSTAGTSASTEPAWPLGLGDLITDGTVTWQAISAVYEDVSVLGPNAIIELFELQLDATLHGATTTYYWHNGVNAAVTGNIVFAGNTYVRLPVEATGFDYSSSGSLPRPTLRISNLFSDMTTLLLLVNATTPGNDLGGAMVRRVRTLKKFLDSEPTADPNARFPTELWYVDRKSNENRDLVEFELASKFDLAGVMLPQRQIIANVCQWKYRGAECGYTGSSYWDVNDQSVGSLSLDSCGKRVESCKLRFGATAELPFGSFPGAGLTQ
jgi:lambda family phage minor tail protein L